MNENLHRVVGIDLGTTYSAVATYNKYAAQSEIIVDKASENSPTTPSVVGLHPTLRKAMVGRVAKNNMAQSPQDTIIEIKREMGEDFREDTLDKFRARNTKKVGDPVQAYFAGEWRSPQEISALILMKMKEIAEAEIGGEIRDAVVTVPAYFTEKQKKATKEAALLAGLYPRQLIPEPTAAAICYGVDKMEEDRKVYLVYDLGGGTFDVSIIEVKEANISVIATSGDPRLGGGDFDDEITNWAIDQVKQKYNLDASADQGIRARIKLEAERAKIRLSTHTSTSLVLAEAFPQQSPTLELTRETFEGLIDGWLNKAITYVNTAITAAEEKKGISRDQVDAILLVGGSSKIPKVRKMLLDFFGKDDSFVRSDLNPDEVVARGAAIMASRFEPSPAPFDPTREVESTITQSGVTDLRVQLITEHSLGVRIQDNRFSKIIDQGSPIPIEITQSGYTNPGPVDHLEVGIYQGEGAFIYENTLIGEMTLGPMSPQNAGFHKFDVAFKLDENGLLSVLVNHLNEGKTYQAKFEHKTGVGGKEALAALHSKLTRLYANQAALSGPASQVPSEPKSYAPPPPAVGAYVPPPPQAQQAVPTSDQPKTSSDAQAVPQTTPAAASPAAGPAGLIEPVVEIPAEFKSIVRRARKKLVETGNPTLLNAFNSFTSALNKGVAEEELQQLGDTLDDIYHKTPDGPVVIQPAVEVPAEFKSIVRRAQKQLLENPHPDLLSAFNAFTTALNTGVPEADLEELGDNLDNIYHNVRK